MSDVQIAVAGIPVLAFLLFLLVRQPKRAIGEMIVIGVVFVAVWLYVVVRVLG